MEFLRPRKDTLLKKNLTEFVRLSKNFTSDSFMREKIYRNFEKLGKCGTTLLFSKLDDTLIYDQRDIKEVRLASRASGLEKCQCTVQLIFSLMYALFPFHHPDKTIFIRSKA